MHLSGETSVILFKQGTKAPVVHRALEKVQRATHSAESSSTSNSSQDVGMEWLRSLAWARTRA